MKSTMITLMSVILIILLFNDADAQKRREMKGGLTGLTEKLNLTEEQKSKMEDLRNSFQEKMIDFRAEMDKARLENRKLRTSDTIKRIDVVNQSKKMSELRSRMAEARANHFMDVYELLNDNQRKVWNELKSERPRFKDGNRKGDFRQGARDRCRRF